MESKRTLQEKLNAANDARDRLSKQIERMDSEYQQEREQLKDQCSKRITELNKQIDQQRDEIDRAAVHVDELTEKLRLTENRERAAKDEVLKLEAAISRLVQPVNLEEVISVCPGFQCTESASGFLLEPEDELLPKLILPKVDSRLRCNNGLVAHLTAMHEYATFQRDSGTKHALPVAMRSGVEMLFLRMHSANIYALSDPRSATHIATRFFALAKSIDAWVELQEAGTVKKRTRHDNIDIEEVVFIAPFVLPNPNLAFNGEIDEDFSEEDIQRKQEEKASILRQEYYKEYLKHYFYKC